MINKFNKTLSLITATTLLTGNAHLISAYADNINSSSDSIQKSDHIRLDYKDGRINNAVAFAENKFFINGNISNGNIDNNYYLSDNNLTLLTESSDSDIELYEKNYLSSENGKCYINLETGKIVENDLQENNLLDATINLRKKIRKFADDRYSDFSEAKSLNELPNYKFNDTWYETKYHSSNPTNGYDSNSPLTVYTDINGNYIDADYNLGSIEVVTTNKTVSIDNTNDVTDGISISVSNQKTIGHDNSNIYRIVTLTITSDEEIQKINGLSIQNIKNSAFEISNDGQIVSFDAIQQISKDQSSGSIDGAKYSKTVSTYILSDNNGSSIDFLPNSNFSIYDGTILSYSVNDDKISVCKTALKTSTNYNFICNNKISAENIDSYDIDSSGQIWILQNGIIYCYSNDEWQKKYKVDGLMDNLSIYDSNNFVVWNTDDNIYTVYGNKTTTTENSQENSIELDKTQYGWIQNQDGTWSFILEDSTKKTGWLLDNSKWYYLDSNGIMKTGWLNTNGKWYYLDNNGSMLSNTIVNGYILNNSGEWII